MAKEVVATKSGNSGRKLLSPRSAGRADGFGQSRVCDRLLRDCESCWRPVPKKATPMSNLSWQSLAAVVGCPEKQAIENSTMEKGGYSAGAAAEIEGRKLQAEGRFRETLELVDKTQVFLCRVGGGGGNGDMWRWHWRSGVRRQRGMTWFNVSQEDLEV